MPVRNRCFSLVLLAALAAAIVSTGPAAAQEPDTPLLTLGHAATIILFFPDLVHWAFHLDIPSIMVDGIGILLWLVVFLIQKARIRKYPTLTLPIHEQKELKKA